MRIAIFGDSYATDKYLYTQDRTNTPWSKYLERAGHTVTNFARSGSSLVFSYMEFLKINRNDYDKIIFVITASDRIYLPEIADVLWPDRICARHITPGSLEDPDRPGLTFEYTSQQAEMLRAINAYYKFIHNTDVEAIHYGLIIEKLQSLQDENILFINTYIDTRYPLLNNTNRISDRTIDFNLKLVHLIDCEYYKISPAFNDARINHMNHINNKFFAKCVLGWLKNGIFDVDMNMFVPDTRGLEYIVNPN